MNVPGKVHFKIKFIPNGLQKYVGFKTNNKLLFIDKFQFLISSSDILVKKFGQDNFKYLSQ